MNVKNISKTSAYNNIEGSVAGWFLLIAAAWELVFNRIFSALGLYMKLESGTILAMLAESGRFATAGVAVMGILLTCIMLPRLAADSNLGSLPVRLILMLTSPLFLPVTCVAVFRPISIQLVLVSYLITISTAMFLSILVALNKYDGGEKRILVALALVEMIAAFELMSSGFSQTMSKRAHLAAETIFIVVPIFAFLLYVVKKRRELLKFPPIIPIVFAATVTAFAFSVYAAASENNPFPLLLLSFKSLGLAMIVPGGVVPYLLSLFLGSLLVGFLIFPSKTLRSDSISRKQGFGLACIFMAGIQPTHPYLYIQVFVGFLFYTQYLLDTQRARLEEEQYATVAVAQQNV